jgi:hypothetical protein
LDIGTSSVPVVIFSTSGTCCNSSPAAGSLTLGECSAPFSDGSSWTFTLSSSGTWRIFFFQRYRLPE